MSSQSFILVNQIIRCKIKVWVNCVKSRRKCVIFMTMYVDNLWLCSCKKASILLCFYKMFHCHGDLIKNCRTKVSYINFVLSDADCVFFFAHFVDMCNSTQKNIVKMFQMSNILSGVFFLQPRIDEKHSRWLHLRIRPSILPFMDPSKSGKVITKALLDGRWTLAFRDEESCKSAWFMIIEELNLQSNEVERRLRPLIDLERTLNSSHLFQALLEASSSV